jgi:hypothetical protein
LYLEYFCISNIFVLGRKVLLGSHLKTYGCSFCMSVRTSVHTSVCMSVQMSVHMYLHPYCPTDGQMGGRVDAHTELTSMCNGMRGICPLRDRCPLSPPHIKPSTETIKAFASSSYFPFLPSLFFLLLFLNFPFPSFPFPSFPFPSFCLPFFPFPSRL